MSPLLSLLVPPRQPQQQRQNRLHGLQRPRGRRQKRTWRPAWLQLSLMLTLVLLRRWHPPPVRWRLPRHVQVPKLVQLRRPRKLPSVLPRPAPCPCRGCCPLLSSVRRLRRRRL
jgi:hypothetical protein